MKQAPDTRQLRRPNSLGGPPNTVRLAHDFVTEGRGQDARATGGAGILPAASSFIPAAALTKLTVLGGLPDLRF